MSQAEVARSTPGLAQRMKDGTRRAHRWIERLAFVRSFLHGVLNRDSYQRLLVDLYYVYGALESGLQAQRHHPAVAPLVLPTLFRKDALAADLDFLAARPGRRSWRMLPMSHNALLYAEHLRHITDHSPELLVAHCYTRYLGDLSGGQILKRMAGMALGLDGTGGLSYYDFPQIPDVPAFKKEFRQRLDALPLSEEQRAAVVAEAVRAFGLSGALLDAIPAPQRSSRTRQTSAAISNIGTA